MLEQVDQSALKGFGHLERMDDGRLTKRIYRAKVDEAIGTGGLKKLDESMSFSFQASERRVRNRNARKVIVYLWGGGGTKELIIGYMLESKEVLKEVMDALI